MLNNKIILIGLLVFFSGCTFLGGDTGGVSETKLKSTIGLGVTSFEPVHLQLPPGAESYIQLNVRNNAEGRTAYNVTVLLDNIAPFQLLNCKGEIVSETDARAEECSDLYDDNKKNLNYNEHFIETFYPGEEINFIWGYKAPQNSVVKGIYYKHDIYYIINYDYSLGAYYNIEAISEEEAARRKSQGLSDKILQSYDESAGPLKIEVGDSQVSYSEGGPDLVQYFIFDIANKGGGLISEDKESTIRILYPTASVNIDPNYAQYGWTLDEDNLMLIKTIDPKTLSEKKRFYVPFKLKNRDLPIQTLTFAILLDYTYTLEGSTELHVKPLGAEEGVET